MECTCGIDHRLIGAGPLDPDVLRDQDLALGVRAGCQLNPIARLRRRQRGRDRREVAGDEERRARLHDDRVTVPEDARVVGVGDPQKTPVAAAMPPVLSMAHAVSSILEEDFFVKPAWGGWATLAVYLLAALYLILLFPRLKAGVSAGVSLGLVVLLLIVHYVLMTGQAMWIELMMPAALIVVGRVAIPRTPFGTYRPLQGAHRGRRPGVILAVSPKTHQPPIRQRAGRCGRRRPFPVPLQHEVCDLDEAEPTQWGDRSLEAPVHHLG